MEDNDTQKARKRKAQVEENFQQKLSEAAEHLQARLALRELLKRYDSKIITNEHCALPGFDDPTEDIMATEARDGSDELTVEMGRRQWHE